MPKKIPKGRRNDLNDWAMTVDLGKECCLSAQSNGADVVGKAILSIVGQLLSEALSKENRFLYLSFAPVAFGRAGVALSPVVTGSRVALSAGSLPAGAVLMAVGIELGNVYGRTVLLNAMGDMTDAVTRTLTQAEAEIRKPKTGRATKRGIFDCDKCVREKALPQHGSRLSVNPTSDGEGRNSDPLAVQESPTQ